MLNYEDTFNISTTADQIKILEDLLFESKRKARMAEVVLESEIYKEFKKWVAGQTTLKQAPVIAATDNLTAFTSRCLVASGIGTAADYFESFGKDVAEIEAQLSQLQAENSAE